MNINSVNLSEVTTYRFGGFCKNFINIESEDDLSDLENIIKGKQNVILGKGSNVAFSENEFDGAVIQSKINYINFDNKTNKLELGSGTYLPDLSRFLKSKNLSDGEFLLGIPGTVGGALSMNSGCYGYEFFRLCRGF